ncbi:MAG: hypothetical protein ACRDHN_21910 [Thermomicrobiales bacterium]
MNRRIFGTGLGSLTVVGMVSSRRVVAQEATPTSLPTASLPSGPELGEGWSEIASMSGTHSQLGIERAAIAYGGPNGSRILIGLYDMPDRFSARSEMWEALRSYFLDAWSVTGTVQLSAALLPPGIDDGIGFNARDDVWWQQVVVGIFNVIDGPALVIVIDGDNGEFLTYRSLIKVAAVVVQ